MALLLSGKEVAAAINAATQTRVAALKERGIHPTLGIVRVGERPDDIAYERAAVKRCELNGVMVKHYVLPADAPQERLLSLLHQINVDRDVHGVLMFKPLPGHMDETAVCNALSPAKDVDGITEVSMTGVYTGAKGSGWPPCTARAAMEILDHYGFETEGKRAVVIGRSLVIGKPAAMMLLQKNATVTICHTRTKDMPALCKEADILIAAAGKAGMVGPDFTNENQIIIDVGVNVDPDGKLRGDVDFDAVEPLVQAITPVPGGVGSVTTSVLVRHVTEAASRL